VSCVVKNSVGVINSALASVLDASFGCGQQFTVSSADATFLVTLVADWPQGAELASAVK
jgi:hypothetical protein